METVVQVLVKDHAGTIVAECPQLIANNDVESKRLLTVTEEISSSSLSLPSPPFPLPLELSLMFSLMDRIPNGVEPMLRDLESYILQSGLDDMKANADVITTVSLGQ